MYRSPFAVAAPHHIEVRVELAPLHAILLSIMLAGDSAGAAHPWLVKTELTLTPAERHRHRLVFAALGEAFVPGDEDLTFDDFLAALAAEPPDVLRDRVLDRLALGASVATQPASTLANVEAFMAQVARLYGAGRFEPTLHREVYALLLDPPALHDLVVEHLRAMWHRLEPEWRRHQTTIVRETRTLKTRIGAANATDALRLALDGDVPTAISTQLDAVDRLVIAVSPHAGPLAMRFGSATTCWVFVQPRDTRKAWSRPAAKRTELTGPLAALADDTRLHILDVLAHDGPLLAQELLARFDLSQPSLSRHLKQLSGTGFVVERRGAGANKRYEYNPATMEWMFRSLEQVLSNTTEEATEPDVREELPELRRFLERSGRVILWPPKQRDQEKIYHYLATKFEAGRDYTEREVNETLQEWSEVNDFVTLRRALYNAMLLGRTPDGARYWKREAEVSGVDQPPV